MESLRSNVRFHTVIVQGTSMTRHPVTTMTPILASTLTAHPSSGWPWTLRRASSALQKLLQLPQVTHCSVIHFRCKPLKFVPGGKRLQYSSLHIPSSHVCGRCGSNSLLSQVISLEVSPRFFSQDQATEFHHVTDCEPQTEASTD